MRRSKSGIWILLVLCWSLLWLWSYLLRPLWPIDETRYVSVAWEMWQRGNFLVPYLNGHPYAQKPPLLFWMIHLGWAVFGVNEWWPRLIPSIFGLGSVFLTTKLARMLWPEETDLGVSAGLVLMGFYLWAGFCTVVMFDLLLSFFVLMTLTGGLLIIKGSRTSGTLLMGAGLGLGILAKGPVIFVHSLPVLWLYPWWGGKKRKISTKAMSICLGIAIALGVLFALLWAIPASIRGGLEYKRAILWGQTAHRVASSFAHRRPWWWYLPWLPLLASPWVLFVPSWRGLLHNGLKDLDQGFRFCISWIIPTLIIFSLFSGKQIYYLLPMLPALALLVAWSLFRQSRCSPNALLPYAVFIAMVGIALVLAHVFIKPSQIIGEHLFDVFGGIILIGMAVALLWLPYRTVFDATVAVFVVSILFLAVSETVIVKAIGPRYDLRRVAYMINSYEKEGRPIAHSGKYHGQFHFLGRLKRPFQVINDSQIDSWLREHRDGRVVAYFRSPPTSARWKLIYSQPYRGSTLIILGAQCN